MKPNQIIPTLLVFAAAALAGCGGGGGAPATPVATTPIASTSTPAPTSTATPLIVPTIPSPGASGVVFISTPTPSTPTPLPTAAPTAATNVTGSVYDLGQQVYGGDGNMPGSAIAGATVVVGPMMIIGATPPPSLPSGDVSAKTSSNGTYTIGGYVTAGTTYVMVFPPTGDTHISLHALAKVSPSSTIRTLYLYGPSASELSTIASINANRATNGQAANIPDEIAFEMARAESSFKGGYGYYQSCIPAASCNVDTALPTTTPNTYPAQFANPSALATYFNAAGNARDAFAVNWNTTPAWTNELQYVVPDGLDSGGFTYGWIGLGLDANGAPTVFNGSPTPTVQVFDLMQLTALGS